MAGLLVHGLEIEWQVGHLQHSLAALLAFLALATFAHGAELTHHLLHLLELLQHAANFLAVGARACRNAATAGVTDLVWVAPFPWGHAVDDRFHALVSIVA